MVDTNALFSPMFSLIANFTNVVNIPPDALPQKPEDLDICVLGYFGPAGAHLRHHKGTEFWIHRGAIGDYGSGGSCFENASRHPRSCFEGASTLSSNELVQIGEKALRRLVKKGDPLAGRPLCIRRSGEKDIPFLEIEWPNEAAKVEIDCRTGTTPRSLPGTG